MRTDALIEDLSRIHPKGFDLSLDRISKLLEKLGNPQDKIPPAIHVAGTNGKGSTIAFVRSILEASGHRVHVHTSPHLVNWSERYRIAGRLVDDETLANAIQRVANANQGNPITLFEIMSAVMFILFSEHDADYSIVEVGLGGRFDVTNVIKQPLITAITPVALDHEAYLGDTIAKIAFEKAGIIKEDVPLVIGEQADDAREVIEQIAAQRSAPSWIAGQDFDGYMDSTGFVFQDGSGLMDLPAPALQGQHQLDNAALAIAIVQKSGITVSEESIARGLQNATWSGRLQKLPEGEITRRFGSGVRLILDGGHNPAAGVAIAKTFSETSGPLIMICGMLNTKDPFGYFQPFSEVTDKIFTVPVNSSDAGRSPAELESLAASAGLTAQATESLEEAIKLSIEEARDAEGTTILFCGSLYLVGEVLDLNGTPPQ